MKVENDVRVAFACSVLTFSFVLTARAGNLAQDTDFRTDNLGGVVNWTLMRPQAERCEILGERGPNGGHAVRLMLTDRGGFQQLDYRYVDSEPYRMSAWVRTKNLQPGNVSLIAYEGWLLTNVKSAAFPSDTDGKWVKVEWRDKMFVNVKHGRCYFGVFAKKAMKPDEVLDVSGLEIEPLSDKARAETKSPLPGKAFVPRIVPIMPKLADVDFDEPVMTFYYPGDLKGRGEIVAYVDGTQVAQGALGADRRVALRLAGATEGRHRLRVAAVDGKSTVATNEYAITVRRHAAGAASGRRLNNLVTELPTERTAYGVYFTAPTKGWYFMSCDNPAAERMQFLDAGRHPVPFPTRFDAKVAVRKIKHLEIGGERNMMKPTDVSRYAYGFDFFDRYIRPSMNTMSTWEYERAKLADLMTAFEDRGVVQGHSISMNSGLPVWTDPVLLAAAITNCTGYLNKQLIMLDETSIERPRKVHYAIAEALWSLADVEDLHLGLYYNDAMRRGFSDEKTAPSVLAAIANCGGGTGVLRPEAYSAALPTLEETRRKGVDWYPMFQDSVERMAPCAAGAVVYHMSGYIAPYLWCDYPAATADFKVFFADLVRGFATNPAYHDIAGISFDAITRMDEELLRWAAHVFRYYGIEGHTDDICAHYGYRYIPGHLKNGDFDAKLAGWEAVPAADGGIRTESIRRFGGDVLCFRECENTPHGDTFVVMKRGASGPNVLRQTAKNLVPGKRYFLSVLTMDYADVTNPGSANGATHFRVNVEGAAILPESRFRHEFATGAPYATRRAYRGKPCVGRTIDRFVFEAKGNEATISLSDWDDAKTPGGKIGGETLVTYVICRPYFTGPEESSLQSEAPSTTPTWMAGKYGLMVHWLYPTENHVDEWTDNFDVPAFLDDFRRTGADWLIFTAGQCRGAYASPNEALTRFCGKGHTPKRDLLLEVARGVKALGKRFVVYSAVDMVDDHCARHAMQRGLDWKTNSADRTEFEYRWSAVLGEWSRRLGPLCDGWWLDGCSPNQYPAGVNWERWQTACRAGNPHAAVAFNGGVHRYAEPWGPSDYTAGETAMLAEAEKVVACLKTIPGHQRHYLFPIDGYWGAYWSWPKGDWARTASLQRERPELFNPKHLDALAARGEWVKPIYTRERLQAFLQAARTAGSGVTVNVGISPKGRLNPLSVELLRGLREGVRKEVR